MHTTNIGCRHLCRWGLSGPAAPRHALPNGNRIVLGERRIGRPDVALSAVTRQGFWVFVGLVSVSALGFAFWILAARLFPTEAVGVAGSLVSLSTFGAAFAVLGLDAGLVRFAPHALHPRKLIRSVVVVTGLLAGGIGVLLPLFLLSMGTVGSSARLPLIGLSLAFTVGTVWTFVMNGAFIAARKAQIPAAELCAYGLLKIVLLLALPAAGVVGLFAAYTIPLLPVMLTSFVLLPRTWPGENPNGRPHALRDIAGLSAGNWLSAFGYAIPYLCGPALVLYFFDATTAAFFFIALQLGEILNYGSEALTKSLFAHGSREDRLARSLRAGVRNRILLVLLPLVALGILLAPSIAAAVGGASFRQHALIVQLFLIATIPRGLYNVVRVQFNVDRRPRALALCGAVFAAVTMTGFVIGLLVHGSPDVLPAAWLAGGISVLGFSRRLAARYGMNARQGSSEPQNG